MAPSAISAVFHFTVISSTHCHVLSHTHFKLEISIYPVKLMAAYWSCCRLRQPAAAAAQHRGRLRAPALPPPPIASEQHRRAPTTPSPFLPRPRPAPPRPTPPTTPERHRRAPTAPSPFSPGPAPAHPAPPRPVTVAPTAPERHRRSPPGLSSPAPRARGQGVGAGLGFRAREKSAASGHEARA